MFTRFFLRCKNGGRECDGIANEIASNLVATLPKRDEVIAAGTGSDLHNFFRQHCA